MRFDGTVFGVRCDWTGVLKMKTLCQEVAGVCSQCGTALQAGFRRSCPARTPTSVPQTPRRSGLGDFTERMLSRIGVTPDRFAAAKEKFGLAPTCNCAKRKEWLNRVGEWLRLFPAGD